MTAKSYSYHRQKKKIVPRVGVWWHNILLETKIVAFNLAADAINVFIDKNRPKRSCLSFWIAANLNNWITMSLDKNIKLYICILFRIFFKVNMPISSTTTIRAKKTTRSRNILPARTCFNFFSLLWASQLIIEFQLSSRLSSADAFSGN